MDEPKVEEQLNTESPDPQPQDPAQAADQTASLENIQGLLKAKNDTSRFVGLALLKSVLDNSPDLRTDEVSVVRLWESISPKFLDRLIRTGATPSGSQQDDGNMLDLAVSVIHTFALLLPEASKRDKKLVDRIPSLVSAILYRLLIYLSSSAATTKLIIETLLTLVTLQEGAAVFINIVDLSSLTEIASSNASVLDIFSFAWLTYMTVAEDKSALRAKVDSTIEALTSSFTGTDGVTLLEFLGHFLRNADPEIVPQNPTWIKSIISFIQRLTTSRPTPEARSAYIVVAASLLQAYPLQAPPLLFSNEPKADKPFSFLFVNLLLIELRATLPRLLELLNTPDYLNISKRISSAFDILSNFVGYLVKSMDDDSPTALVMPPDFLLKLRKAVSETMSLTIEFLRDRWDASVAGAMGLHPDARVGAAATSMGSHMTLTWDSMKDNISEDPLLLASIRALAIWLREDDNEVLRKESMGLCDMFMELYQLSSREKLDFRLPILVALEGLLTEEDNIEILLTQNGWQILTSDLLAIFQLTSKDSDETEASRGIEVVRILLPIVESESSGTREDWMGLITTVSAWDTPDIEQSPLIREFQIAVLQLATALLVNAPAGMRKRYIHSMTAIIGIANQLQPAIDSSTPLQESLDDVLVTLGSLR